MVRHLGLGCLAWFLGASCKLHAHQDPPGDIRPAVVVRDGKFEITFQHSNPNTVTHVTDARPMYRMIHNADGTLFAPRHAVGTQRPERETGPAWLDGRSQRLGNLTFIFPAEQRTGKPAYLLDSGDGRLTRVRLPWPESVSLDLFEDARVVADGIAITGKQKQRAPGGAPLEFFWFPHNVSEAPVSLMIGDTANIYDFPVASNIVFAGGRFWVAFMRPTKDEMDLAMWSWQPGEKEPRVEKLDSPATWNTHLSLAAIGDHLCLAYHWVGAHEPFSMPMAEIITVFREAR